jgi:CheY-like chemotaxis protein/DNA-directed RNA polymerase specialized sigma24 family protein
MSVRSDVVQHLPFLRRYARALAGSQASGDAYVRAVLETLLADPDNLDAVLPPRVALFRLFHVVWGVHGAALTRPAADRLPAEADGPEARLASLAPIHRQALLLTAMEGFTVEEAGAILDVAPAMVDTYLADAQRDIERDLSTGVLIIEDEALIALDLEAIVTQVGHSVVGIAATRLEAIDLARREHPGLVLADIQLADGSTGIAAARSIVDEHDVPVVFITGYPERLLTGSGHEPTYVVTKPFQPESIQAAISQALFFHAPRRAVVD